MKEIIVNSKKHGVKTILVDDKDFCLLSKIKWTVVKDGNTFYAKNNGPRDPVTRQQKATIMHRKIMGVTDSKILIDHKDHNGLNNQRSNLRVCNESKNGANRIKNKNATSSYIGVCWAKESNKWNGFIQKKIDGKKKTFNLGYFASEIDAAKARDAKAKELFGEFANLNFK